MGLDRVTQIFSWSDYSTTTLKYLENPRSASFFTKEDTEGRGVRLVIGKGGHLEDGNQIALYWLVDEEEGVIVDALFQAFGHPPLVGMGEGVTSLVIGKNYDQVGRMGSDLVEKTIATSPNQSPLPKGSGFLVNLVLEAMEEACAQCSDIPFAEYTSPLPGEGISPLGEGEVYPGWEELSLEGKLEVIEQVLDKEIRPYIAMDAGGLEVLALEGNTVKVAYQGSCTSCYSATGATLSAIQQVLQSHIDPTLIVEPDLENLTF